MQNIKNQILAPPQQRMNSAEVSAARRRDPRLKHQLAIQQIQTESSQSINRSSGTKISPLNKFAFIH